MLPLEFSVYGNVEFIAVKLIPNDPALNVRHGQDRRTGHEDLLCVLWFSSFRSPNTFDILLVFV